MISKKLAIMKALTTHLQGIVPAWIDIPYPADWPVEERTPCPYDMSKSVFRGRLEFGDEVKNPFLAILEAPRQLDPNGAGNDLIQDEDWTLLIQGFADDNQRNPLDPAYDLLAWTQMRMSRITMEKKNGGRGGLYPNEWRLGGLIADVRYQIPIVRPGKDTVSDTAYFYMPISVGNVTDLTMPFVQEN